MKVKKIITFLILLSSYCEAQVSILDNRINYQHPIDFQPKIYTCKKIEVPLLIDGLINEDAWDKATWTEDFVDIQGSLKASPYLKTRAKLLWDDQYLYIAAYLEEPQIWAKLKKRDAVIYYDDDFEVFIDPDGDGHNYLELEMNALNTFWDLLVLYPYYIDKKRNYMFHWNCDSIRTAVHIEGTLNNPSDIDAYWSVELAIPLGIFKDFSNTHYKPENGMFWRLNFSRVDWPMEIVKCEYTKKTDHNGKVLAENNWVWSPTGSINMHLPETWGYLYFIDSDTTINTLENREMIKWGLWQLYYQMKECVKQIDPSVCKLDKLTTPSIEIADYTFMPKIEMTTHGFEISATDKSGNLIVIDHRAQLTSYPLKK